MDMHFGKQVDRPLQVLVFGTGGVGKTTLIGQLHEISALIFGHDMHVGQDDINGNKFSTEKIVFQEATKFPFPSFERLAIHRSDAFILTYDVDDDMSFDYVSSFLKEIKHVKGQDTPVFVVGNKTFAYTCDGYYEIHDSDYNKNMDCTHIQVCALNGDGMKELFSCMLGRLCQHFAFPTESSIGQENKKQSLRKRISDYFRKKLYSSNTN